ncbi:unnamed protein product, partial [Plutella xylostella]
CSNCRAPMGPMKPFMKVPGPNKREQKTSWNRRSAIPNEDPAIRKPLVVSSKVYDVLKQLQDKEELKDESEQEGFLEANAGIV